MGGLLGLSCRLQGLCLFHAVRFLLGWWPVASAGDSWKRGGTALEEVWWIFLDAFFLSFSSCA